MLRAATIKGVIAKFTVARSGSMQDVEVAGAPSKSLSDEIALQISVWLVAPSHTGSVTVPSEKRIELNILCPPRFPGLIEPPGATLSPQVLSQACGRHSPIYVDRSREVGLSAYAMANLRASFLKGVLPTPIFDLIVGRVLGVY
jgi:hypothetical protein